MLIFLNFPIFDFDFDCLFSCASNLCYAHSGKITLSLSCNDFGLISFLWDLSFTKNQKHIKWDKKSMTKTEKLKVRILY